MFTNQWLDGGDLHRVTVFILLQPWIGIIQPAHKVIRSHFLSEFEIGRKVGHVRKEESD